MAKKFKPYPGEKIKKMGIPDKDAINWINTLLEAGFSNHKIDAIISHKNDPLADIKLDVSSYGKIAQLIKGLNLPTFAVLEGGYNEKQMPFCLESFLQEFK